MGTKLFDTWWKEEGERLYSEDKDDIALMELLFSMSWCNGVYEGRKDRDDIVQENKKLREALEEIRDEIYGELLSRTVAKQALEETK
jgi:hypothetical protein